MLIINPVSEKVGWDPRQTESSQRFCTWNMADMLTFSYQAHHFKWIKHDFYTDYQELLLLMNELSIISG